MVLVALGGCNSSLTNVLLIHIKLHLPPKQLQKFSVPENLLHMNFDMCSKKMAHGCNIETSRTSQVFITNNLESYSFLFASYQSRLIMFIGLRSDRERENALRMHVLFLKPPVTVYNACNTAILLKEIESLHFRNASHSP